MCIDIDGVIVDSGNCTEMCDYEGYPDEYLNLKRNKCPLKEGAVESIRSMKDKGYKIILFTSRISAERKVTEKWLKDHNIYYDELVMDKPIGFIYIDDNGYRFKDWTTTINDLKTNPDLRREDEAIELNERKRAADR